MHTSSAAHACPISSRHTPHQQPTHTLQHLTMQQHTHASLDHTCSLLAPHTHIHLHTPNIEPCGLMLKNKDLNFKALIQEKKTQSESLSPHSTMSHAHTHTHLYANQNQHHHHLVLIALFKSKHNPIFTKEKKKYKALLIFPQFQRRPNSC